jgi:hypothetical protein
LFRNEAQQKWEIIQWNKCRAQKTIVNIIHILEQVMKINEFFDMDVKDQATKMLQNIETQTEPQPKRKLLYEKIVGESLQPEHMAHSSALVFFIC